MKIQLSTIICVFCAVRYHGTSEVPSVCPDNSGSFGYEVLLGKLEDLELKFWNMLLEMKEQIENHSCLVNPDSYKSCAEVPSHVSGKYMIHPLGFEKPFEAYCEQNVSDGGWIVVQYRFDGSVDFYRNWTDYKNGFGRLNGEFWIGLEKLHRLTKGGGHQLLVELKTFNGSYATARYDEFEIGNEDEKYELKKLGSYRGTAGDGLAYHKNRKFSTEDNDNDEDVGTCAKTFKGGWWYKHCFISNLHGLYRKTNNAYSIIWNNQDSNNPIAYSRMMIRKTP